MRISLLLEREPFGAILERTLENFWSTQYGQDYRVCWQYGHGLGKSFDKESQEWLVNIYLNAIFKSEIASAAFDPIRREFARSTIWWRRPLQRSYVALATKGLSARPLAQARLHVSPATPEAANTLIVAGNHKLRLLNHDGQTVKNVLKSGFHNRFMRREIEVRQRAEKCGVPIPALQEVHNAEGWYTETYVSGTPTNRLADHSKASAAVDQAANALHALVQETGQQEVLFDYLSGVTRAIRANIAGHHLLTTAHKEALLTICKALANEVDATSLRHAKIMTALTHGDFQPANILVNGKGPWLIDWEYTARRQSGYDALVFGLGSRAPSGLAERMQHFVEEGAVFSFDASKWPGLILTNRQERQRHALLFLLEELLLHLEENSQPPLTRLGSGLSQLQQELTAWLTRN